MALNPLPSDLAAVWDAVAMVISFAAVLAVVQINSVLQKRNVLPTIVTRKLVHILVGPVFLVTWLLYSGEWFSRYFAAVVPLVIILMFYAIGSGRVKNEAFVSSMSRSGDASELLLGTFYYTVIILIVTLLWFYDPLAGSTAGTPLALIVIGCLAGGDGLADIVGRRYGKHRYTIAGSEKSVEGSIGMIAGSIVFSLLLVAIFNAIVGGWDLAALVAPLFLVAVVAMVIEACTPRNLDNWTISASVVIVLAFVNVLAPDLWKFALFGGA